MNRFPLYNATSPDDVRDIISTDSGIIKVTVANQTARYALTKDPVTGVQNGDYVYQTTPGILYAVIDDTLLNAAGGYVALASVTAEQITNASAAGRDWLKAVSTAAQAELLRLALADIDWSFLPSSNPGGGKVWLNSGVMQVGS